jgi:hypothetical protein
LRRKGRKAPKKPSSHVPTEGEDRERWARPDTVEDSASDEAGVAPFPLKPSMTTVSVRMPSSMLADLHT